jgi:hypothetical protein
LFNIHRQTVIRAIEIAGAFLVLLDVVLYFGMFRTVQRMAVTQKQQLVSLRGRIVEERLRIEHLQEFRGALPDAAKELAALERNRIPSRRQAFSQAAGLLRHLTEISGTQLANVSYKLDKDGSGPLLRLAVGAGVAGPLPALLKFAHELETASDLIVIQSFSIASADKGALMMRLNADLYLMP